MLRAALARLLGLLRRREVNYFYALDQFKVGNSEVCGWAAAAARAPGAQPPCCAASRPRPLLHWPAPACPQGMRQDCTRCFEHPR